jgi:hypothetical protein
MSVTDKVAFVFAAARKHAAGDPQFHAVLGPGRGDNRTMGFMANVQLEVLYALRGTADQPTVEQKICGENSLAVDFYFPDEATIVEIALGLPNPGSEFEKDILKALMAKECGHEVRRLVFISRPGAAKICRQPGRAAMIRWAREKHGLHVEVLELDGEPRVRKRASRG